MNVDFEAVRRYEREEAPHTYERKREESVRRANQRYTEWAERQERIDESKTKGV
jgi:hypothetical protein